MGIKKYLFYAAVSATIGATNYIFPGNKAIPFDDILKTGSIDAFPKISINNFLFPNQYIDWKANDIFTRTIKDIGNSVFQRIAENRDIQDLLAQPTWTREDRAKWEEALAKIVSEEVDKIPGLDEYRTSSKNIRRVTRLNDLWPDIGKKEVDCEILSVIKGIVIHIIENTILPNKSSSEDNKTKGVYYYINGQVKQKNKIDFTNHSFIFTPIGNIIESTFDPSIHNDSPYMYNQNTQYTLSDLSRGWPILTNKGHVYGGYFILNYDTPTEQTEPSP